MLEISEKCISCGRCVDECPALIISLNDGMPELKNKNSCIFCGHCEAVCPVTALKNPLLSHDESDESKLILDSSFDPKLAENFLRSRRSFRTFKKDKVKENEAKKLIDIGRYAQTGGNSQGVSYMLVSEKMPELKKLTIDFFKTLDNPHIKMLLARIEKSKKDIIFRDAPMCIFALTDKDSDIAKNAFFALTYIELFAPALGLGTCWAGYLEIFVKQNSKALFKLLDIPENLSISGALLAGYPAYRYKSVIERNPLVYYNR